MRHLTGSRLVPASMTKPDQPASTSMHDELEVGPSRQAAEARGAGHRPLGWAVRRPRKDRRHPRRDSEITSIDRPPISDHAESSTDPRSAPPAGSCLMRDTGKLIFLNIRDWTGDIQLFIGKKQVGEQNWAIVAVL